MARIILEPAEEFTFTSNLPGVINGHGGSVEVITISDDADLTLDATFNRGGDIINLTGDAADFQVSLDGSQAVFTSEMDGITLRIPVGEATEIRFEGQTLVLQVNEQGQVVLGEQVVTDTPADVSGEGAEALASLALPAPADDAGLEAVALAIVAPEAPAGAEPFFADAFAGFVPAQAQIDLTGGLQLSSFA